MSEQRLLPLKKRREETRREVVARAEEREFRPIVGPMGLWHYPILNTILQFLERLRELRTRQYSRSRTRVTILEWVRDEKGRVLQLIGTEKEM